MGFGVIEKTVLVVICKASDTWHIELVLWALSEGTCTTLYYQGYGHAIVICSYRGTFRGTAPACCRCTFVKFHIIFFNLSIEHSRTMDPLRRNLSGQWRSLSERHFPPTRIFDRN